MSQILFRVFIRSLLALLLILPLGAAPTRASSLPARAASAPGLPEIAAAPTAPNRQPPAAAGHRLGAAPATLPPPLTVAPPSLTRSFVFGSPPFTDTTALTLTNTTGSSLGYLVEEQPAADRRSGGSEILLVSRLATSANTAAATALTNLGYTFDAVGNAVFETTPISELLSYQAVVYIGNTGVTASSPSNTKLMAYLDAGGRLLIADNNLGFNNGDSPFYQTYLDATYGDNNPDPVNNNVALLGRDIMGGLDTPSADPEPDFFTPKGNSVRIFRYAVDQSVGGSRITRNNYRAVYIATDFNFLGTSLIGDQIETSVMQRSLGWLIDGAVTDVVPWISETPTQGSIPAGASRNLAVAWYPASMIQPGAYTSTLRFEPTQSPTATVDVPVTMIVTPSPAQARITGVLTSSGICDSAPLPLVGATVFITDTNGFFATASSDSLGRYSYYLPGGGAYLLSVFTNDHLEASATIDAVAGSTMVRDLALRLNAPCIGANPPALAATLPLGDRLTSTLTITSSGAAPLNFRVLETTGLTAPSSDGYGYVWTTQPAAWVDASDGVEYNPDDDDAFNIALPFAFPFYDLPANQILVGNNGGIIVAADDGSISFENQPIDGFSTPDYFIAPFWDDLLSTSGAVYVKAIGGAPNRAVVVEWVRPHAGGGSDPATFEAVLYENGNILYQYQDADFGNAAYDNGASATVGLRGYDADTSLGFSFDDARITAGLSLCFVRPGNPSCQDVAWLNVSPSSGGSVTGTPPTNRLSNVGFDASVVPLVGTYTATLAIVHNAPQPVILIPVSMDTNLPSNYGTIDGVISGLGPCDRPGAPLEGATVRIGATAPVTATTDASGRYAYALPAGTYALTAAHPGYQTKTASVNVTAQVSATTSIALRRDAPCESFAPAAFESFQLPDVVVTQTLIITNYGAGPLNWQMKEGPLELKCSSGDAVTWLSASPISGTVPPGEGRAISVATDSHDMPTGLAVGWLCLLSNDPIDSGRAIPVSMTVLHGDPPRWNYLPLITR